MNSLYINFIDRIYINMKITTNTTYLQGIFLHFLRWATQSTCISTWLLYPQKSVSALHTYLAGIGRRHGNIFVVDPLTTMHCSRKFNVAIRSSVRPEVSRCYGHIVSFHNFAAGKWDKAWLFGEWEQSVFQMNALMQTKLK